MNKSNEEIDEIIKKALSQEEAQFYEDLDEQNLPEQLLGLYKGKLKWITLYATLMQLALTGLAGYCAYQFFTVETVKEMVTWGVSGLFLALSVSMIKLFHWMQMNKNSIVREIKRIELQISMMNRKE
ncbi:MAG: hypothetical protein NXI20_09740 [bacterium]|jgi:hypothetical protein|nr:hypothetical protein [bacterium]